MLFSWWKSQKRWYKSLKVLDKYEMGGNFGNIKELYVYLVASLHLVWDMYYSYVQFWLWNVHFVLALFFFILSCCGQF